MAIAIWGDLAETIFRSWTWQGLFSFPCFCHYSKHFYAMQPKQVAVISSALKHLSLLAKRKNGENILIDSTGLPNSIHFPLTAISNHNGKISNEVRLIYVVQQKTNLPLYFRYIAGNIVDVSTLTKTMLELKAYNVDTKFAVLDAGYLTEDNLGELFKAKVSFLSRMKENTNLYKNVVEENLSTLETAENLVSYNGRYAYIKRVKTDCWGHSVYAYLGRDLAMQSLVYMPAQKPQLHGF